MVIARCRRLPLHDAWVVGSWRPRVQVAPGVIEPERTERTNGRSGVQWNPVYGHDFNPHRSRRSSGGGRRGS
jgi:hypothetical protein